MFGIASRHVTPDRPCTAYFKAGTELTVKNIFDSFVRDGIAASAVRCLQRKPTGEVEVTFTNPEHCLRFLDQSTFIFRRRSYPVHPTSGLLTFLTIYDAPYELPDTAIEHRLRPYCTVFTRRRGKLQGYPDVYNGIRHYRVQLKTSVPCYLRFGKFQIRLYHDRQRKTCRRCGVEDHIARDCQNEVCFNCDERGHTARHCPEVMLCCVCKSPAHKAIDCPLSWFRRPATVDRGEDQRDKPPPAADEDPDTERSPPPDRPGDSSIAEENPAQETPADVEESPTREESEKEFEHSEDENEDDDDDEEFSDPPESLGDSPTLVDPQPEGDPDPQEERILNSQGLFNERPPKENLIPRPPADLEVNSPSTTASQPEPSEPRSRDPATATTNDVTAATNSPRPPRPQRPKPVRRQPAKLPEMSSAPARRPTKPTLVTTRRSTAAESDTPEEMDTSKCRKRKNENADDLNVRGKQSVT